MERSFDIIVIGAGWAGYSAAQEASSRGLKTCLIEKGSLGGTCLNQGCIPTKILSYTAKLSELSRKAKDFGLGLLEPSLHLETLKKKKEEVVSRLRAGMEFRLKQAHIEYLRFRAALISPTRVQAGDQTLEAKNIILATGSVPFSLPGFAFDGKKILSSDNLLNLDYLPKRLLIIGGGVIGCEFASILNSLGVEITIVELLEQLLPGEDGDVSRRLTASFKKRGIKIYTSTRAEDLDSESFDAILVAVGRSAHTQDLGLEGIGINISKNKVSVDERLRTSIPHIYAVGDCIGGLLLAHVAAYEGEMAVRDITSGPIKLDYSLVPSCIFTQPEIGSVGLREKDAKEKGIPFKKRQLDFLAVGMAHILDETEGFIKIIEEEGSTRLLGASIIGPKATELITILSVALHAGLTADRLKELIFAHPTLSEGIKEAL